MGTGWLLITLLTAMALQAWYIRRELKRHAASIAIIQIVLAQVADLLSYSSWKIIEKRLQIGKSPNLYILLSHSTIKPGIHFTVNNRYSLCELISFKELGDEGFYEFNLSRPAHYFDTSSLAKDIQTYEKWAQSEPYNFDWFVYPPTGGYCSNDPEPIRFGERDKRYKGKKRMANKHKSVRYPILDY